MVQGDETTEGEHEEAHEEPVRLIGGKKPEDLTVEEYGEALISGEIDLPTYEGIDADTVLDFNRLEQFIVGDITWAQLMGMTVEEAYGIAEHGYAFFEEGRYHDARTVFEGLVMCNPYDAYFHAMAGAVYQQLDMPDEAFNEYSMAIAIDENHLHAYVNRGEMQMMRGELQPALEDLKKAIELDPNAENTGGQRARALIVATMRAMENIEAGQT